MNLTIQGVSVPALGLGTWDLRGADCVHGVEHALRLGYRHFDTAQSYENETEVGRGIKNAGVARAEIFLVTKVRPQNFAYDDVLTSTAESLRKLDTDYADLLLLHWPNPDIPIAETMRAMRKLQDDGAIRHIGVSNFSTTQVEEAAQYATIFCNQVEFHPYQHQDDLLAQSRKMDYLFTAYSPLDRGKVTRDETLKAIGAAHNKTAVQVVLRWMIQLGMSTIPKAGSDAHRAANFASFDFALSEDEMQSIYALGEK